MWSLYPDDIVRHYYLIVHSRFLWKSVLGPYFPLAQIGLDFNRRLLVGKGSAESLNQISVSNIKVIADICAKS